MVVIVIIIINPPFAGIAFSAPITRLVGIKRRGFRHRDSRARASPFSWPRSGPCRFPLLQRRTVKRLKYLMLESCFVPSGTHQ